VLAGEVGRRHGHAPARQLELGQPELSESLRAVDQDVAVGLEAFEQRNLMQQRRVLNDQRVGLGNRLADPNRLVVDPAERNDGRTGALGAEARERLCVLAALEGGDRQQLCCGNDALAASAVYSYLEDAPTLVGNVRPSTGFSRTRACRITRAPGEPGGSSGRCRAGRARPSPGAAGGRCPSARGDGRRCAARRSSGTRDRCHSGRAPA
jgi:hypothetical protein